MESTMVIKVKYGDTLRRFNASIDENEKLDLDINGLREKILGLFNFPPDADLTLTYVDEDGDIVTLVDDDDLCDVMRQRLKFLRINVQLNSDKNGRSSYARSSGSSTPMRPPRFQPPLPDLNNKVAEILKSVPESLREVLSKQSLDFASKSASSNPMLADLVESFLKMGFSHLSPVSQPQSGVQSNTQAEASDSVIAPSVPRDLNVSKDADLQEVFPKPFAIDSTIKSNKEVMGGNVKKGAGAPFVRISSSVDLNLPPNDSDPIGSTTVGLVPAVYHAPVDDDSKDGKEINGHPSVNCVGAIVSTSSANPTGSCNVDQSHTMGRNPSMECPFSGIPIPNDLAGNGHPRISPSKRNAATCMFHRGVQCDGCGAHPIVGPRFKSKVKEDYDLCNICFDAMGNGTDYIRMDRPWTYRHPRPFRGFEHSLWLGTPTSPQILRDCRIKASRPKLDSNFISDVNVLDGTLMAPSTPFIKIWRMRNSGNIPWPQGAKLWWIGGDKFSDAVSVEIEIPTDGLPVNGELDIAIDFTAPELPGRYISYWRMASPFGVKFGQRVWVLIQVDASLKDSLQGLNLNLPPESNRSKGPEIIDANVQPIVGGGFQESRNPSYITAEPVKPVVDEQPKKEQEQDMNFPINDSLLVGHDASASAPPPPTPWASSTVFYPIIDLSEDEAPAEASPATPAAVPTSPEEMDDKDAVEQSLLKELEEMGFRQVDLNKEILRMNEYNLEQSVDALCGVADAEWDPILEELQEMGFRDDEMNKKLLKKNNGSIKRVVMDLLTGEKP
ncbi:hypothetical protein Ddye_002236 [Dipteronia dyeriana]|uniref:Protein NBR1 homolog n=1 Tax=Dipteronia dyeriana TaxID=168575 RepID=A0AAD9XR38_9ROSI|nr:hypothetical protein Ddye_002236 [Dipteronia dyeriana]